MKNIWHKYIDEKPPMGVEVIAYHHLWVNEDFNPRGFRIGFLEENINDDGDLYDFVSAHWWNEHDDYTAISKLNCVGNDGYSKEIQNSCEPEYWIEIPEFIKPEEKIYQ